MTGRHVRVCARGVVRRGDELLVARERDELDAEPFYYLLGGGVEFGEHSEEALRREFDEELGVSLENVSHLQTYEDVFSHDGAQRHEIWRVYEADIVEDWPYEAETFEGYEPHESFECVWKPVAELGPATVEGDTFYPAALLDEL